MFGKNIKAIRIARNIGVNELSRLSGVNASYISALERDEKKNPSVNTLEKLAAALDVSIDEIMKPQSDTSNEELSSENEFSTAAEEDSTTPATEKFNTAEEAIQFILKQPAIMGYGGFDINKLSNEEIVQFANELLNQLQLLGLKYKK